jgi:hypothetical protein
MPSTVSLSLHGSSVTLDPRWPRPCVMIGRDPSCGLVCNDPSVSRRHAEVFMDGEAVYLRDLNSSNGTWVDGQPLPPGQPVPLRPGQQVFVGHGPLVVEWSGGAQQGATVFGEASAQMRAMMDAHRQQAAARAQQQHQQQATAAQAVGVGGLQAPKAGDFPYRRQGSNENGVLLIALRSDTYQNGATVDGYLEFTALDDETVASIIVELVEFHKRGPSKGHVWDRMLVRQGPWKARKNELLPLPFQLRVPPGVSNTGRNVNWVVRGYVDIDWAFDIAADSDIMMRNVDVEKVRDALGALDFRVADLDPEPLGQRFTGTFQPPAQLRDRWGISDINLAVEYLGTNLQVEMEVEKTALLKFDRQTKFVFELSQLRSAHRDWLSQFLREQIEAMMAR